MSFLKSFKLLLFVLLLCSNVTYGQVTFGVKAGINASKGEFKPYQDESLNYIIRYHAGILAEIDVYKGFYIKPEVLYSIKGWNTSTTYFSKGIDMNLHYINIPILAGYRINDHISFLSGIEYGYLLKAGQAPGGVVERFFKKRDLGFSVGTVFNFASRFGIELRYTRGFKGLLKDVAMTDEFGIPTHIIDVVGSNMVFQISTRYRFNF
jgi:hypothetical protein